MRKTFNITHLINSRQQTVVVEARDADEAQENFVAYCEERGIAHGAIQSIRASDTTLKLHEQRYVVSPCGFHARYVHTSAVETQAPDWTDCTHLTDAQVGELMVRRMNASKKAA